MNFETNPWGDLETDSQQRRKATRICVSDRDDCIAFIKEKAYLITDLSPIGIGLLLPVKESFRLGDVIGDVLTDCRVKIAGQVINSLDLRIVYICPATGENMLCGMEWVNQDIDKKSLFRSAIDNLS
ncbi:MAG: hypothetical protein ABIJ31_14880 [Pseudomonadota bacterium]